MKIKNLVLGLLGSILLVGSINIKSLNAQSLVTCTAINRNTGIIENDEEYCKFYSKEDSNYYYFTFIWEDGIKTRIKISKKTNAAILIDKNSPVKTSIIEARDGYILMVQADTYTMVFGIKK